MKGEIFTVKPCITEVPSVTYAQKAKAYLAQKGLKSEIVRNTDSCGYSVKAYCECETAERIFDEKGIPYNKGKGISSW